MELVLFYFVFVYFTAADHGDVRQGGAICDPNASIIKGNSEHDAHDVRAIE